VRSWPAPDVPVLPAEPDPVPLRLHDSARGLVEVTAGPTARLYVCGITPYDATHLGHAATYLAFDVLVRVWRDRGHEVDYVQNVTDIDDPLLERAARDGEEFREDMTALRVLPPTHYVGAVEAMDEVSATVQRLLDAGAAYRVDEDVYFPVTSAPGFGEVSGYDEATMLALSAERGGDPQRPGKRHPLDPLLWRAERPGEPAWDAPVGRGRPGWHVECAAIALGRLTAPLDVQGGGSDLVFPHHEMSAAHAEALGEHPFASAYVHAGMVGLDGEKMSKSRGNLVFVSRLREEGTDPMALRLALLGVHYRSDRSWTASALEDGEARLARWRAAVARPSGPPGAALLARLRECLWHDLDAPACLTAVDAWASSAGDDTGSPALVRDAVDALLGVRLSTDPA
jgi:L-cysteine:1D-myo-inositol 2-amino-2-deoxy-alpha-D-glucopyranoside ligase